MLILFLSANTSYYFLFTSHGLILLPYNYSTLSLYTIFYLFAYTLLLQNMYFTVSVCTIYFLLAEHLHLKYTLHLHYTANGPLFLTYMYTCLNNRLKKSTLYYYVVTIIYTPFSLYIYIYISIYLYKS